MGKVALIVLIHHGDEYVNEKGNIHSRHRRNETKDCCISGLEAQCAQVIFEVRGQVRWSGRQNYWLKEEVLEIDVMKSVHSR